MANISSRCSRQTCLGLPATANLQLCGVSLTIRRCTSNPNRHMLRGWGLTSSPHRQLTPQEMRMWHANTEPLRRDGADVDLMTSQGVGVKLPRCWWWEDCYERVWERVKLITSLCLNRLVLFDIFLHPPWETNVSACCTGSPWRGASDILMYCPFIKSHYSGNHVKYVAMILLACMWTHLWRLSPRPHRDPRRPRCWDCSRNRTGSHRGYESGLYYNHRSSCNRSSGGNRSSPSRSSPNRRSPSRRSPNRRSPRSRSCHRGGASRHHSQYWRGRRWNGGRCFWGNRTHHHWPPCRGDRSPHWDGTGRGPTHGSFHGRRGHWRRPRGWGMCRMPAGVVRRWSVWSRVLLLTEIRQQTSSCVCSAIKGLQATCSALNASKHVSLLSFPRMSFCVNNLPWDTKMTFDWENISTYNIKTSHHKIQLKSEKCADSCLSVPQRAWVQARSSASWSALCWPLSSSSPWWLLRWGEWENTRKYLISIGGCTQSWSTCECRRFYWCWAVSHHFRRSLNVERKKRRLVVTDWWNATGRDVRGRSVWDGVLAGSTITVSRFHHSRSVPLHFWTSIFHRESNRSSNDGDPPPPWKWKYCPVLLMMNISSQVGQEQKTFEKTQRCGFCKWLYLIPSANHFNPFKPKS